MGRKLYVGNLPYTIGEAELQELFGKVGQVESVRVMRDMATGRARGFAFVEMATDEEAQKAVAELQQAQLGGGAAGPPAAGPPGGPAASRGGRIPSIPVTTPPPDAAASPAAAPPRSSLFVALPHRNFRLLWSGQLVSFTGSMSKPPAILWHVSLLVAPGQRALALGMVGLIRVAPIVVFSTIAGVVADLVDRRRLMMATQSASAVI